jgi:hypothetical protein
MIWGSYLGRDKRFFYCSQRPDRFESTQPPAWCVPKFFAGGITRTRRHVDHLPPSKTKVKNEWSYTSTPPICLQGVDRDNFIFFLPSVNSYSHSFSTSNVCTSCMISFITSSRPEAFFNQHFMYMSYFIDAIIQGDQKVSVHLMITVQKTSKNILNSFNHLPWQHRIRDNRWR